MALPKFDSPKNWTEDYNKNNGNYVCRCSVCKEYFYGYKRRTVCKVCDSKQEELVSNADVSLRKIEVVDGALDIQLESEQIVRFYVDHMKQLFDSIDGADNYLTVDMKFHDSDKFYTITFQKHPGKTPTQAHQEEVDELNRTISSLQTTKSK